MDPLTISLLLGVGVTWSPKTGEFLARLKHFGYDQYNQYLRPSIDRLRGNRPPLISVRKISSDTFEFNNVELTNSAGNKKIYNVTLKLDKKDISLAELDFSNWQERKDFHVTITTTAEVTDQSGTSNKTITLSSDTDEYDSVIKTLGDVPLFLGHGALYPDDTSDLIREAWNTGNSYVDIGLSYFQAVVDKVEGVVIGNTVVRDQDVDLLGGQNPHFAEKDFVDRLINVVEKTDDPSLLENYFKTMEKGLENELKFANREIAEREAAIKESSKELFKAKAWLVVARVVAVITAIPMLASWLPGALVKVVLAFGMAFSPSTFEMFRFAMVGAVSIAATFVKSAYNNRNNLLEKLHLKEAKAGKEFLKKTLDDVKTKRVQSLQTIRIIQDLSKNNKESLALQSKKGGNKIGNLEINILSKYLMGGRLSACTKLTLANNDIGTAGAEDLATALKVQTTKSKVNIREIDLKGNNIGVDGVEKMRDVLLTNITLTNIQYDSIYHEITRSPDGKIISEKDTQVSTSLRDGIDKQLLINSYLQGKDFSQLEGRDRFFPEGEKQIREEAKQKVAKNFAITAVPFTIRNDLSGEINDVIRQNQLLGQLSNLASQQKLTADAFIDAFKINPARCLTFVNEQNNSALKDQIATVIVDKPFILKVLKLEERQQLLLTFGKQKTTEEAVELLANIIEQLPPENTIDPLFKDKITDTFKDILGNLQTYNFNRVKDGLEKLKKTIAKLDVSSDKSGKLSEQRENLLKTFSVILNPQLSDPKQYERYALNLIVEGPNSAETFEKFIQIYQNKARQGSNIIFNEYQLTRFRDLIKSDVYDGENTVCTKLKSLLPLDRQALLEIYFKGEPDAKNRALLVSRMIDTIFTQGQDEPVVKNLRDDLYYSFYTGMILGGERSYYNYEDLKTQLEVRRQEASMSGSVKVALEVENLLQTTLQEELKSKYKCLASSSQEDFVGLKEALNKGNFELRNITNITGGLPGGAKLDPGVQKYLEDITKRNKLLDIVEHHPSPITADIVKEFFAAYKTMDPKDLTEPPVNLNKLMDLVRFDVCSDNTNVSCAQLRSLDSQYRVALLSFCFQKEKDFKQKAELFSQLLSESEMFDAKTNFVKGDYSNYFYYAFPWPRNVITKFVTVGMSSESGVYGFDDFKSMLKTARQNARVAGNNDLVGALDKQLQTVLQEELKSKYKCLASSSPEGFSELKVALDKGNFDVRDVTNITSGAKIDPEVQKYLEDITKRNKLLDIVEHHPSPITADIVKEFFAAYKTMDPKYLTEPPLELNKLMDLVRFDVCSDNKNVSCAQLRSLDPQRRVALLSFCFQKEKDFKQKAELFSQLLSESEMFDAKTNFVKGDYSNYFYYAFPWPRNVITKFVTVGMSSESGVYGFDDFKSMLKTARQNARVAGNNDLVGALDKQLQTVLQEELKSKYKCLASSSPEGFSELKVALDKGNFDVRDVTNITSGAKIDPEVQKYLEDITKRNKLLDIVEHHPSPITADIVKEFFAAYKTMDPKYLTEPPVNFKKLVELVNKDIDMNGPKGKETAVQLRVLDGPARRMLLKFCFKDEYDYENKATLVSSMIAERSMFDQEEYLKIRDNYLHGAFIVGNIYNKHSYDTLKNELEVDRKAARVAGDSKLSSMIDNSLQRALQMTLVPKFKCLRDPFGVEDFDNLKTSLNNNFDLRDFKFPTGINKNVQEYIEGIIIRNKLHDAISCDFNPKVKLQEFLKVLPMEQTQIYLQKVGQINANQEYILNLVKSDIGADNYSELKSLDEARRASLLMSCLGETTPDARGIATLVSKLIEIKDKNVTNEYIWRIFDWKARSKWDFATYILNVKDLIKNNPSLAPQVEQVLQTAIQENLVAKYKSLSQGVDDFLKLKEELKNNFDLVDSSFVKGKGLSELTVEYVDLICQRNLLKKHIEAPDFAAFIKQYSSVDSKNCKDMLAKMDRFAILKLITKDLGSDAALNREKLLSLDEPHRVSLLEHCFALEKGEEQYAHEKAVLVSKMLKSDVLFSKEHKDDKRVQEINKQIYWAISTEGSTFSGRSGVPYYRFNELKDKLGEITAKISVADQSLKKVKTEIESHLSTMSIEPKEKDFHQDKEKLTVGIN